MQNWNAAPAERPPRGRRRHHPERLKTSKQANRKWRRLTQMLLLHVQNFDLNHLNLCVSVCGHVMASFVFCVFVMPRPTLRRLLLSVIG